MIDVDIYAARDIKGHDLVTGVKPIKTRVPMLPAIGMPIHVTYRDGNEEDAISWLVCGYSITTEKPVEAAVYVGSRTEEDLVALGFGQDRRQSRRDRVKEVLWNAFPSGTMSAIGIGQLADEIAEVM